jgi:hypothetical protein
MDRIINNATTVSPTYKKPFDLIVKGLFYWNGLPVKIIWAMGRRYIFVVILLRTCISISRTTIQCRLFIITDDYASKESYTKVHGRSEVLRNPLRD